ncbi:SseB family protein [Micromonospora sp. MED01]|uniref:SseB family protein n=1 Tax=Micromonospora alfalfae TaxID=2911212 RepID=UPI001EE85DBB|nr:SseB family protein [Micromonospora alfalfae]MCG5466374.1 SseB family protein [Micromonospora alfalfae]
MTSPSPTWPEIAARLRDTVARCDRDTDLELSAGSRGIRLLVRRQVVRVICPGHDEARLAALGWHRPTGEQGWWYEAARTPEQVERLSVFVTRTAAEVLTDEPGTLSCRPVPPDAGSGPTAPPNARRAPAEPPTAGPGSGPAQPPTAGRGPAAPPAAPGSQALPVARPARVEVAQVGAAPAGATPAEAAEPAVVGRLAAAVDRRDLPGYLAALAGATVCVPLAGEPTPDADFPWTVVGDATGAPLLPVFTSPGALAAFAGDGVPFVALPCAELFEDWPDRSWGLAVDPGSPRALALAAPALAALLTANVPTA